jgi:hypothetical protein
MRKVQHLLRFAWGPIAAVVAVLLVCIAATMLEPRQPSYQGRRLSDWLSDIDISDFTSPVNERPKAAVRAMGTAAVEYLVKEVTLDDHSPRGWLAGNSVHNGPVLRSASPMVRRARAHIALIWAASDAKAAVPALARALRAKNPDIRVRAANCLGWVASKANADEVKAALKAALGDPNPEVRQEAAWALKKIGANQP